MAKQDLPYPVVNPPWWGICSKARISARKPPSRKGPLRPKAGNRPRSDRTQPALARLGERERRAECTPRVRAESLVEGTGSQPPKRKNRRQSKRAEGVWGCKSAQRGSGPSPE